MLEHAEQASSSGVFGGGGGGGGGGGTGLLNKGGGSNRFPGLVTKQQAVEFAQVYWLVINIVPASPPPHTVPLLYPQALSGG